MCYIEININNYYTKDNKKLKHPFHAEDLEAEAKKVVTDGAKGAVGAVAVHRPHFVTGFVLGHGARGGANGNARVPADQLCLRMR